MANGAYRTSELPQTTSMANTDRVVILYNAAGNPSVGNGSPGTRTIPLSKLIDSGMSEVFVDIAAANSLAVGNASSNLFVNSSSIIISNFEGTTFSVDTNGVIEGNGYDITSVQANNVNGLATVATSGSYNDLNNKPNFAVSAFLDTSNASNINTGTLGVGVIFPPPSYETLTIGNSSVNIAANSTSISVGTVNATANAIAITNSSIHVGNDSVYTVITANSVQVGNGTVYMNSSVISIGNSTVNIAYINSTSISIGNSSVNTTLSATGQVVGNVDSELGGVTITNNYIYCGNSLINTYMNAFVFYAGNVSFYSTLTPTGIYAAGVASQSSIQPSSIQVTNGTIYVGIINSTANGVWINTSNFAIGNATVNTVVNSTAFSGISLTANDATNLGGVGAASYVNTSGAFVSTGSLTFGNSTVNAAVNSTAINLGNSTVGIIVNSSAFSVGTVNATTVGTVVGNSSLVIGNSSVNATINSTTFSGTSLAANNSTNLGGTAASGYQTTAGLSTNVATLIANNTSYVGTETAANIVSNAQLSGNLTTYSTTNFAVANVAANGSFNLPGGWHIAFGLVQTNSTGGLAVTFANAFTSNAYSVTVSFIGSNVFTAAPLDRAHVNAVTKTGFTVWTGNTSTVGSANVYFQAIGY